MFRVLAIFLLPIAAGCSTDRFTFDDALANESFEATFEESSASTSVARAEAPIEPETPPREDADFLEARRAALEEVQDPIFPRVSSKPSGTANTPAKTEAVRTLESRVEQLDREIAALEDWAAKSFQESRTLPDSFAERHFLLQEERAQVMFELELEELGDLGRVY